MKKEIQKIAIVRLSALGDIVNTAVVLQFIKAEYPHAKIDWITEEVFAPLIQDHPLLNAVHTVNLKALKKSKSLSGFKVALKRLRSLGPYDIIIDVQGLIKSSLVARAIGKNTHGFDKASIREALASWFYKSSSTIPYDANIIKRNTFVVADPLGLTITDEMLQNKEMIFACQPYSFRENGKKNVAVVIGASWESKKYPKEKIAQLCDELGEECHLIWGSEAEHQEALWIWENSSHAKVAPRLNLKELVAYISGCDLLIGNDTGPTHMAWAQNVPSITLFGPTTSRMIYETPKNVAIKSPSEVNIYKINKNDFSIQEIQTQSILDKAKELLYNGS